jgi:hypothetical protein
MQDWITPTLIGIGIGLIVGYFIARRAASETPIKSGLPALVCNYIASAAVAAIAPTMFIAAVFFRIKFLTDVTIFLGLMVVATVALLVFGAVEPA